MNEIAHGLLVAVYSMVGALCYSVAELMEQQGCEEGTCRMLEETAARVQDLLLEMAADEYWSRFVPGARKREMND